MTTIILTIHIVVCIILMGIILLQAGKGASIGAAFGSGGSQTIFGGRGPATFFQKFTTALAVLFMVTSISLARFAKTGSGESVIEKIPAMGVPITTQPSEATDTVDSTAPEDAPETE